MYVIVVNIVPLYYTIENLFKAPFTSPLLTSGYELSQIFKDIVREPQDTAKLESSMKPKDNFLADAENFGKQLSRYKSKVRSLLMRLQQLKHNRPDNSKSKEQVALGLGG